MRSFTARNVNSMLRLVLPEFKTQGVPFPSRNGPVLRMMGPTCLTYTHPLERVCFCPIRDANPFFHLFESMWMLAGRNDVKWISFFNSGMAQYSDDGETFNAAYGHRLRHHFKIDQLNIVVNQLMADPNSRQAVAQLWDSEDLLKHTKDKACNLCLVFTNDARPGEKGLLGLTVYNRSNDAVWGTVAGANPVHMSYFQQYVADCLGWSVGDYHQITANLHYYTSLTGDKYATLMNSGLDDCDQYRNITNRPYDLMVDLIRDDWMEELNMFINKADGGQIDPLYAARIRSDFISTVLLPLYQAWVCRKDKDYQGAYTWVNECAAFDWRLACVEWMDRRDSK